VPRSGDIVRRTQERRAALVFTATLFVIAAAWLFFLFAYADLMIRHSRLKLALDSGTRLPHASIPGRGGQVAAGI
jgi:hypothetical protein